VLITESVLRYVNVAVYVGQTDRQTDRQTDSVMVGGPAVAELWLC